MANYEEDPPGSGLYRLVSSGGSSGGSGGYTPGTGMKIRVRRGLASEWNEKNPILAFGEPGYDVTNNVFKMGDGIHNWQDLPLLNYLGGGFTKLTQAEWDALPPEDRDENLMYVIVQG
ncbi:hypothetical protein SEA_GIBBLES_35 [Gordonia phage Gibbles]|nr:hypothetical protein SEA_GIBBLES_35 [Gordonia phage Gibbles]